MKDLRRLLRLFFRQRVRIALAAVFTIVQCAAQLCLPIFMAQIVDRGVMQGDLSSIMHNGIRMLIACFVLSGSGYAARILSAVSSERFAFDLRGALYDRIHTLSVDDVSAFGSGSLITRLTSDVRVCASLMGALLQITFSPLLLMLGGTVLVWRLNPRMGLIFLGFIVVQIVLMLLFIRRTSPMFRRVFELTDRLNAYLQQVLSRLRLVKILTREQSEDDAFGEKNTEFLLFGISVQKIVSVFQPTVMMIVDGAAAVILLFAARSPAGQGIRVGEIMETISYAQQVLLSIVITGRLFQLIAQALPCAARLCEVLDAESSMRDGELPLQTGIGQLDMNHVCFRRPDSGDVLFDISISVRRGDFLVFLGPTGCGKSTLASLCARLRDADSGSVLLDGTPIASYRLEDVRRHIALVEKDTDILAGSFRDNILFGRSGIEPAEADDAALAAQCAPLLRTLPDGADTPIVSMGRTLSGGERQRLAIARALAGRPDILILDDCTSSLDYLTEERLLREVRSAYPQMTILLFGQRAFSAAQAGCVYYMERGRIVGSGSDAELRNSCPAYRAFCAAGEGGAD